MSALLRRGWSHAFVVALCVGLAACSSTPKGDDALNEKLALQEKVDAQMNAADAALKAGHTEQAMSSLDEAIKLDPAAKQPWLKKAQFHFEKRQYGMAITQAQEVLQRDVNDNTARSILAVSGLRVSAEALDQLRKANEVTGSARSEAESVAKIIREALGEPILVPAAAAAGVTSSEPAKPAQRTQARPAAPRPAPAVQAVQQPAGAAPLATTPAATAPARVASTAPVNTNVPAPAAGAAIKPRPAPAPAAGNGRSNPFGALQ